MPRELLVLRHAKSDWHTKAAGDYERPLNKRGRRDAPRMGRWLLEQRLLPDHLMSSPATRARETALALTEAMGIAPDEVQWAPALYLADRKALLAALADCPGAARRVLLVGHNPGLEDLTRHLVGDDLAEPDDGKLLPTAAVAHLALPEDWSHLPAGCARCLSITRPKALNDTD